MDNSSQNSSRITESTESTESNAIENLTNDSIVNSIIRSFVNRSNVGVEKYNTTLDRTDLAPLDWINHAQEELMDGILYLEKLKQVMHPQNDSK